MFDIEREYVLRKKRPDKLVDYYETVRNMQALDKQPPGQKALSEHLAHFARDNSDLGRLELLGDA